MPLQLLPLFVWFLCPAMLAYQAPEDKEDIFTTHPCPGFLVFQSVVYLSDMTIELPCHCKPADVLSVLWYYQKALGTTARVLTDFSGNAVVDTSKVGRDSDLRGRFSIRLFSLIVFRVWPADAGHYVCGTQSGEFFYGYDLDVQVVRNVLFGPALDPRKAEPEVEGEPPFRTFTRYWPWSGCDRCGVRGEQVRIGLCHVTSRHLQVRYLNQPRNVTSCGSSSVPARFGLNREKYGAELSVRPCQAVCPPPKTKPYPKHITQFLGVAAPGLRVYHRNHPTETDLVLSCPGARPEHAVAWDKESTALYRSEYMEGLKENSRLFIDTGHHLHFRPAITDDKGTYYCWIQGAKAAEIRLAVHSRLGRQRKLSDPEALFALGVIFTFYGVITAIFLLILSVRCIWMYRKERRAAH